MAEIPNEVTIDFTQVLNIWVTLKVVAIVSLGLYASFGKGDGLNRLFKVIVFGLSIWLLVGCVGPDDSIISQSKTQQAQIQANAEQQQLQAQAQAAQNLLQQQQQQQQAAALQQAQAEAQMARDDAQRQQAEALAQQAQAQQLQAGAMSQAIVALDSANKRASGMTTILMVGGLIAIFSVAGALLYFRMAEKGRGQGQITVSRYDQMTDSELLGAAQQAGYLVAKDEAGKWAIVDRNSMKRLGKRQLLLELKKGG